MTVTKTGSITDGRVNADELWNVAWTYIKTVVDTVRQPFLILDEELQVLSANRTFYAIFQTDIKNTEGKLVYKLGNGQWNIPRLKVLLEDILPKNSFFEDFKVSHDFLKIGRRVMILNARRVYTDTHVRPIILLAMEDITRQVQLEDQLKEYTKQLSLEVSKRTAELEIRVKDLEKVNQMMVAREREMEKLKKEMEKLKEALKKHN